MKHWLGIVALVMIAYGCEQHTARRYDYAVHGIDVSHYQSRVNWQAVAQENMHFAFIKATEGAMHVDSLFCYNWEGMKKAGLKRGAYHFFRPTISPLAQADNFTRSVEIELGDLPPVLDVEVLDGVSKESLINGVRTWLYYAEIRYGVKPIIYTNIKFYNKLLAGHFNDYPMWIARYGFREPTLACGRNWHFWQYGNRGRVNGIAGNVDFNVFKGSLQELEAMCLAPRSIILTGIGEKE
ncbi:MAG: glycoside hydrolase family 25 protein [Saprospiraceae bacterium]